MDKYKLKHNLVLVLCAHYLLCRVKRILNSPGRGGRGRHLFDVNTVLWAQFYAESHSCPLPDKPAKSAIWWTWIFKLLTAVIPETVQYLSNTGYGSFFRRTTSAFPSIFTGKHRHVRTKAARYGERLDLISIYIASLSLDTGFDAVIYSVVYKWILHTTMLWLSEEPSGNSSMCARLYLLFQVDIFTVFSVLLNRYLKLILKYYLFIVPISAL